MSSQELTTQQVNLLSLGLKFTPTPCTNSEELIKDTREFTRKLRLGEYFLDADEHSDDSIARNKSKFMPPRGRNYTLDKYIDHLHASAATSTSNQSIRPNISYSQRQALKALQENQNLIIKEADKGGAIVLMDRDYYQEKIQEMLGDTSTYKEIPENMDKKTLAKINRLTTQFDSYLTEKEKEYLVKFESKSSNIYGLPKIHKSNEIIQAIENQNKKICENSTAYGSEVSTNSGWSKLPHASS